MRVSLGDHLDAVDDRADGDAESASGAVGRYSRQMCLCVKFDGLIAGIVACHVTFAWLWGRERGEQEMVVEEMKRYHHLPSLF